MSSVRISKISANSSNSLVRISDISVDFTVVVVPEPLVVDVGTDRGMFTDQTVSISAVASGGTGTIAYAWTKVSGPTGTFSTPTLATSPFTPTAPGVFVLRCTVTDSESVTASDDLTLTVTDAAPPPPDVAGVDSPAAMAEAAILGPTSELVNRIEICESDGTTRWNSGANDNRLIDGSVTVDYTRDERRSFDLTLDNSDFVLVHDPAGFWYDKIIKTYCGVKYIDTTPVISTQVRTNLSKNPRAGVNTAEFSYNPQTGGAATPARITSAGAPNSDTAYEITWTTAPSAFGGGVYQITSVPNGITGGSPYSVAASGRCSKDQRLGALFYFYDNTGLLSAAVSDIKEVNAGDWVEFKYENRVSPTGTTRILVGIYSQSGTGASNWEVGDKLAMTSVMIEQAASISSSFNGATPDFANHDYSWTGSPENSSSTEIVTIATQAAIEAIWEVQVGEFMIDNISESNFPYVVKVTGRDYTKKCLVSKFTQATAYSSGTAIETAIKSIAQAAGVTKFILPLTGHNLGKDYFFERGVTRWEAMKQIADGFGYELFFDAQGYLVMREYLDPITAPLSYTLETGAYGTLVSYEKSLNDSRIYNHIVVTGESSDSTIIPVAAEATNNEPSSPTRINKLGDRVYQYTSSFITTVSQAQDVANKYLKIHALEEFDLNFSSIALPWLEVGEIVQFNDPRPAPGQPTRFLLTGLTLPLGLGAMSGNAKRVSVVG